MNGKSHTYVLLQIGWTPQYFLGRFFFFSFHFFLQIVFPNYLLSFYIPVDNIPLKRRKERGVTYMAAKGSIWWMDGLIIIRY